MQVDQELNREDRYRRQNMMERRPGAFFNDEYDDDENDLALS
jgi:hypothetical protein